MIEQKTFFAFDCGATNWRVQRLEYQSKGGKLKLQSEPQPVSLTSFVDRKLPAALCLNAAGSSLESIGEVAQQQLEDEKNRERVREYFKPCIGSHLEENPLPHQIRYTHTQALQYTGMLLKVVLEQLSQEKWRGDPFDERLGFIFAYPLHWRHEHGGTLLDEFKKVVHDNLGDSPVQLQFVAEPEGAILHLQHRNLLTGLSGSCTTLIIDIGGSTTDIVAGRMDPVLRHVRYIGHYGEPFGGGLFDAELAKFIADGLGMPASAIADDPSALVALRIYGQRLKESLSRQVSSSNQASATTQRTITLVSRNGKVYRRGIGLDVSSFSNLTHTLMDSFGNLIDKAMHRIGLNETDISQVVLVGGGSQLFSVHRYLRSRFGKERVILADNPEEIVVQGIGLGIGQVEGRDVSSFNFPDDASSASGQSGLPHSVRGLSWTLEMDKTGNRSIPPGVTHIGRGETNEIQLEDLKASRLHAELHVTPEKVELLDMGSTNGTFHKGKRIPAHQGVQLDDGDEFTIGNSTFRLISGSNKE